MTEIVGRNRDRTAARTAQGTILAAMVAPDLLMMMMTKIVGTKGGV